ncbi:Uncharacterised protein [Mycobacteroides abscessus subsp. abscessus]|nr:Uncharacterised protein [Mycobacteroides abscessus subsp. abscessus]
MMAGHIHRLDDGHVLDLGDIAGMDDTKNLRQPRIHSGAIERRSAAFTRLLQYLGDGPARRVRVVLVTVMPGDPIGGGHNVDARFQHLDIEILVGEHAVEGQHVGFGGDDFLDGAGRDHPVGFQPHQFTGVPADLFRRVAMQSGQFQVGMRRDAPDHLGADVAGGDLEHPDYAHAVLSSG